MAKLRSLRMQLDEDGKKRFLSIEMSIQEIEEIIRCLECMNGITHLCDELKEILEKNR